MAMLKRLCIRAISSFVGPLTVKSIFNSQDAITRFSVSPTLDEFHKIRDSALTGDSIFHRSPSWLNPHLHIHVAVLCFLHIFSTTKNILHINWFFILFTNKMPDDLGRNNAVSKYEKFHSSIVLLLDTIAFCSKWEIWRTRPSTCRPIRCDVWIVERMRYPTDRQTNGHS